LVGVGADLRPETLVVAYSRGMFPMPLRRVGPGRRSLGWWAPDPRAILPLDGLVISRSLRRSLRRYEVRIDGDFRSVIEACRTVPRPHGWLTPPFVEAYTELHHRGLAHSVECWSPEGELVGGLYGVAIGGFFAGESMFHLATDASKVALVTLVETLRTCPDALLDVQWATPHLRSLGVITVPASEYRRRLALAIDAPSPWGSASTR
jgi:leucyl/phenylalanyl-tRNA--protein transferase